MYASAKQVKKGSVKPYPAECLTVANICSRGATLFLMRRDIENWIERLDRRREALALSPPGGARILCAMKLYCCACTPNKGIQDIRSQMHWHAMGDATQTPLIRIIRMPQNALTLLSRASGSLFSSVAPEMPGHILYVHSCVPRQGYAVCPMAAATAPMGATTKCMTYRGHRSKRAVRRYREDGNRGAFATDRRTLKRYETKVERAAKQAYQRSSTPPPIIVPRPRTRWEPEPPAVNAWLVGQQLHQHHQPHPLPLAPSPTRLTPQQPGHGDRAND